MKKILVLLSICSMFITVAKARKIPRPPASCGDNEKCVAPPEPSCPAGYISDGRGRCVRSNIQIQ